MKTESSGLEIIVKVNIKAEGAESLIISIEDLAPSVLGFLKIFCSPGRAWLSG